jgi:predicted short-subunit dehydrogenase-like oxidoreductase (DUF2520 family)
LATTSARRPRVLVVGVGRLGSAVAVQLVKAGWPVTVRTQSPAGRRQARRLALPEADAAAMSRAELCLLTVPDAAVAPVARAVAPLLGPSTGLVHCAGALTLEVLQPAAAGRPTGSFHPLVSVTGPGTPLSGHSVAIATRSRALAPLLGRLAGALGLRPLRVPEDGRAAYHAGAAMAASGLVSLLDAAVAAWREAGVGEREALVALVALMRSALSGAEERGTVGALTGPVVRGDAEVVQAHVRALPDDVLSIYLALQQRVLARAADRLARPAVARMAAVLGPEAARRPRRSGRRTTR